MWVGPGIDTFVPPFQTDSDEESVATIGDWLLLDAAMTRARRLLRRHSLFASPTTSRGAGLFPDGVRLTSSLISIILDSWNQR